MSTDETIQTPAATDSAPGDAAVATAPILDDAESVELVADLGQDVPDTANLDMLLDVNLRITVELGRAQLKFRDVLNLSQGTVVELSRQTSEPVDILVNGALLATGEVVVVDDHFAVRITKLLNRIERLKRVL
ncbi:MAG: flagellar motor switch protein FliN [bacterium]|nr:flagellar motor switch protein FliN [bacterium]